MDNNVKQYSPKDLTLDLNISDSSFRKWCLAIEEAGYLFSRTDNNRRIFSEYERTALKQFRELVQVQNLSLTNAAIIVAAKLKDEVFEEKNSDNAVIEIRSSTEIITTMADRIERIETELERKESFNSKLLKQLDERDKRIEEQQQYIIELLHKQDEAIKRLEEVKKEPVEEELKDNRGLFARLFGK